MSLLSGGSESGSYKYETLECTFVGTNVLHIAINRPKKMNAMNSVFWRECRHAFDRANRDGSVRAIVLSGNGKIFSAGIDLNDLVSAGTGGDDDAEKPDVSRRALRQYHALHDIQAAFNSIANCLKPVIAAVHNGCVGGGVDMICAADIRLCSTDAWFCVKEVDVGLAADVGTLQRFPKIVGNDSLVRELCFTSRKFDSKEALDMGLVSRICGTKEETIKAAEQMALLIASKSPVAVVGTKANLNYSRDHSVADGLLYVNTWNMAMLQTSDIPTAVQASFVKNGPPPAFAKL